MLKRIPSDSVRIGMYIDEFCGSWMDHPFWRAHFVVRTAGEVAQIRNSDIGEVWIDTSKGIDVPSGVAGGPAPDRIATVQQVERRLERVAAETAARQQKSNDLHSEIDRAARIFKQSRSVVTTMFGEARLGQLGSIDAAKGVVDDIADSVTRHPSAIIGLARLKSADDYTFMHSMAASALMVALARALGHDEERSREAGMAGLLHDVGKAVIPLAVLNKPDTLNDEEWQLMRSHPERGCEMLRNTQGVDEAVLDAIMHHHEKMDGTGYPHRLPGERIGELARMTAICDVYDAVTSDRAYKAGWEPTQAIRKMAEWTGHFDETIFRCFVRTVGIYPLGSLVRLKSERLAVVVDHNPANLLQPVVKVFFSLKQKMHIAPQLVQLDKSAGDRIIGYEDPAAHGFKHLRELWLPPAALSASAA